MRGQLMKTIGELTVGFGGLAGVWYILQFPFGHEDAAIVLGAMLLFGWSHNIRRHTKEGKS